MRLILGLIIILTENKALFKWKEGIHQTDDVLVIGIRV
jgi:hypothetical protein